MVWSARARGALVLWAVSLAAGCGSCGHESAGKGASAAKAPEKTEPASPAVGTIEGVVRLAEGAKLPEYARRDLGDKQLQKLPAVCPPRTESDLEPVKLEGDRGLAGVLVTATGFHGTFPHEPSQIEVAIRDCRLEPRLVVGQRGDQLVVRNETNFAFLPRLGSEKLQRVLTKGQSRTMPLERGGAYPLACTWGVPCGRTDVIVLYHPVYAVTGSDGHFRIDNVPAGQHVTVHAWHPLFQDATAPAEVAEGKTVHLDLTLAPRPQPPAGPPASAKQPGPALH